MSDHVRAPTRTRTTGVFLVLAGAGMALLSATGRGGNAARGDTDRGLGPAARTRSPVEAAAAFSDAYLGWPEPRRTIEAAPDPDTAWIAVWRRAGGPKIDVKTVRDGDEWSVVQVGSSPLALDLSDDDISLRYDADAIAPTATTVSAYVLAGGTECVLPERDDIGTGVFPLDGCDVVDIDGAVLVFTDEQGERVGALGAVLR